MLMARDVGSPFKSCYYIRASSGCKPSRVLSGTRWYGSIDSRSATRQAGTDTVRRNEEISIEN